MPSYATNREARRVTLRFVLYCSLFLVRSSSFAQNLVANSSFEEADTCAVQLGFFPNGLPQQWVPISETPDYFRTCVPYGSVNGIPVNTFGFQFPHHGESYSGIAAYLMDDYREMIGTELIEPLTVGQTYYGSFWANAAYGGPQQTASGCNNTGMLFTMTAEPWVKGMQPFALRNSAQIYSQQVISDTTGWTLVSGSFIADSAYRYLVIGNHFSNINTTVEVLGAGVASKAYVLVDAVCLSSNPQGCPMFTSITENALVIGVWPNPVSEWLRISWGPLPIANLMVIDAMGRRVVDLQVSRRFEVDMDVNHWPNGIYRLLLDYEGVRYSKQLVVMH